MSSSTTKKVLVVRFDREPLRGFVNPQSWLLSSSLELLRDNGTVTALPFDQVKAVCFVRDWDDPPIFSERRSFTVRPKSLGLWVALRFRDGDEVQGILPNNLALVEPQGISITPPESASNTQKLFAPRQALREVEVLGVIGARRKAPKPPPPGQIGLFGEDTSSS